MKRELLVTDVTDGSTLDRRLLKNIESLLIEQNELLKALFSKEDNQVELKEVEKAPVKRGRKKAVQNDK